MTEALPYAFHTRMCGLCVKEKDTHREKEQTITKNMGNAEDKYIQSTLA